MAELVGLFEQPQPNMEVLEYFASGVSNHWTGLDYWTDL